MSDVVHFTAYGVPAPKGSTKSFVITRRDGSHGTATTAANPRTKDWQYTIAASALAELALSRRRGGGSPIGITFPFAALELSVTFYLPRPKALLTKSQSAQVHAHTKKPDLDKLLRAAKDALTGVLWTDDAQVTDVRARKRYCGAGEAARAVLTINLAPTLSASAGIPLAALTSTRGSL